jgi:hypothetical protein
MANEDLPTMHVTDPYGIGFNVKALDIDELDIRIWRDASGGLRIESTRQERIRIQVHNQDSITITTE